MVKSCLTSKILEIETCVILKHFDNFKYVEFVKLARTMVEEKGEKSVFLEIIFSVYKHKRGMHTTFVFVSRENYFHKDL